MKDIRHDFGLIVLACVVFFLMIAMLSGCANLTIKKECHNVNGLEDVFVCKNLSLLE